MTWTRCLTAAVGLFALGYFLATLANPPAAKKDAEPAEVSYYRDIRPIFQQHCQGCHQPAKAQGSFVMTDYPSLLKKGDSDEPGMVAGKPDESLLVKQITPQEGKKPAMPQGKDPLIERDVNLIKKWIAQGAKDDTPMSARVVVDMEHPPTYILPPVITTLDYSPDGQLLAVAGHHEVLLHKADGSGIVARLVGLSERIQSVAFSPDGKLLAVSGGTPAILGEVQVWDIAAKKLKMSVPVTYDTVYGVSWSHDGTKIAFGCADNTVRAIEAKTGKQVLYQGAHNDWVLDTVFSKDSSHLVSVSRDRSMKLTHVATQRFIDNITSITPGALKGGLMTVARHPLSDQLLIGGADGVPKIYKMHREKKRVIGDDFNLIREFASMPGRMFAAEFNADGSRLVAAASLEGRGEIRVYHAGRTKPDSQALSASVMLRGFGLGRVAPVVPLHDFEVGRLVCTFEGPKGAIYALAFRPDGKQVASAGFEGVVRLNDAETGKLIKEFVPMPLSSEGVAAGK